MATLTSVKWDAYAVLCMCGYTLCMVTIYGVTPQLLRRSGAASMNLTLLMADLYSLLAGIWLFGEKVWWVMVRYLRSCIVCMWP